MQLRRMKRNRSRSSFLSVKNLIRTLINHKMVKMETHSITYKVIRISKEIFREIIGIHNKIKQIRCSGKKTIYPRNHKFR